MPNVDASAVPANSNAEQDGQDVTGMTAHPAVTRAPLLMSEAQRKVEKKAFDLLFNFEPRSRAEGEQWLEDLGNSMERIMEDAEAYHRMKLQRSQPDVGLEEAKKRLSDFRKRLNKRK